MRRMRTGHHHVRKEDFPEDEYKGTKAKHILRMQLKFVGSLLISVGMRVIL